MQELAREASAAFERRTRTDGEEFVALKDTAPEWLQPIVMDAHGEFLPEDWRYACIEAAFDAIADCGEDAEQGDVGHEFADGYVDVYTGERLRWLASNLNRQGYVDQAREEFGPREGIAEDVGMGQFVEALEVFNLVWEGLAEVVEDLEDEEEEADA
jgi:hypothetical protein